MSPWKKHEKNIKKAIKIFQFSWAMKTLKFWANPWNTHENTMKIFGCFHGLLMALKMPWITKKDFHGVVGSSWSFHEATEFMAHEKPMVIPLMLKD